VAAALAADRGTYLRHGTPRLKTTLVQCAWAAVCKKGGYLQAQFQRLRARRGPKKAICAVAASILTAAYHMLRDGTFYQDLGPDHLSRAPGATGRCASSGISPPSATQSSPRHRRWFPARGGPKGACEPDFWPRDRPARFYR
jgi:hypothetical protein